MKWRKYKKKVALCVYFELVCIQNSFNKVFDILYINKVFYVLNLVYRSPFPFRNLNFTKIYVGKNVRCVQNVIT